MKARELEAPLVFGPVVLDVRRRELTCSGSVRHLRAKSFDVLSYLARHPGRVVAKDALIEAVWGGAAVTDDSIVQCLVDIRRALEPGQDFIRTIRGRGYRFDAEVRIADGDANASGRSMSAAAALPEATASDQATSAVAPQVTLNPAVVQQMAAGEAALRSRSQADIQRARLAFEAAVQADPRYAPARAALSNTLTLVKVFGLERPSAVMPRAEAEALRALELDPTYALAWSALAHAQVQWARDWAAAEANYRRALALDPRAETPSFLLAYLLMALGRAEEARQQSLTALRLDPLSPRLLGSAGLVHYVTGRPGEAVPYFQRALEADPQYSLAAFWQGVALTALGRLDEAMRAALRSRANMGNVPTWLVGYVHARAGRGAEAREVLRAMEAHAVRHYVPAIEFAYLHLALGERDAALTWLERGFEEHSRWMELLAVDPVLAPIRQETRFSALVRASGLPG